MSPYRFCLWGGRKGYVQIGSPEDRRIKSDREALERWARAWSKSAERFGMSIREAGAAMEKLAVPASEAMVRLRDVLKRGDDDLRRSLSESGLSSAPRVQERR